MADVIVVSATPGEALVREWQEHDIARYARVIAGQEMGTKKEHLAIAAKGKYPGDHMLMIGDAPGDMKAARANGALFFPINPGHEDESWERFYGEAMARFLAGEYAGAYEDASGGRVREPAARDPTLEEVEVAPCSSAQDPPTELLSEQQVRDLVRQALAGAPCRASGCW